MLLRLVLGIGLLLTWSGPAFALGGGGGGGPGIPGVKITNLPASTNQCIITTSTTTATWQSCPGGTGNLPSIPGTAGEILSENASAAVWVACSGDATCSAVTPGAFTVIAIRGNAVKAGTPTDAQFYVYNVTNTDLEPVSLSGDVTITNAGVATVGSTHITGAVTSNLPLFTSTGNLTNYNGSACSNQVGTGLSATGTTTCTTVTSNYVDTSIGKTGGDLSIASPTTVTNTHIAGANAGGIPKYGAGGTLGNATSGGDYAPATSGTAILKGNNAGGFTNAVSKTDYAPATTGTAILKGDNLGGFQSAIAKQDYVPATTGSANTPVFADGVGGTTPGTRTGNTTQLMTFSGSATASKCIHTDASGNATVTSGDCGVGTGFINTPTVTAGAVNLGSACSGGSCTQCTAPGCVDFERVANGANTSTLAFTTGTSSQMTDGEEVAVEVDNDGTHQPSSITWTAGTGVTLVYGNLGAAATAATCGTAAATGFSIFNWIWDANNDKLTLHDCAPVPNVNALGVALGGTGASTAAGARTDLSAAQSGINADITSLTNLTTPLPVNEGGTASTTAAAALTSLGAAESGVDINTSGQVTATHLASALPVAQGGTGQTTLTSGAPLFGTGTSGITQGTVSGNTTEVTTFSGAATASRCLHTDANGNATVAAGDCTTGTAATPGFINSPTVTTGATNLGTSCSGSTCMQCVIAGCTDYERVANGTNVGALTITTATKAQMTDGETLAVEVDTDGTHAPSSVAWTAGTNVALAYGNLGAGPTTTSCPPPTATGQELYQWQWNGSTTPGNLTLKSCQPIPAATNLSVALGGTQCSATTIGTLPVTPPSGTTCLGITNAASCTAGTAVSTTGSTPCPLSYVNGAWYPALGALSAAAAGFTTAGTGLTPSGSTISLTVPVAVANGGTGGTTQSTATANNIGAAGKGANSDITSLTGLTTPLSVAQGGTGGTTQSTATANNIGAAGKGANSDITSLTGLTTPLTVTQGGTGQSSLTSNAPLFGNGTGGIAQGSVSGNTLELASFSGAATPSRCLHTDANGNAAVTSTDCTAASAPGFTSIPTVTASGGNSTTTLAMQCGGAGCIDYQNVANAGNTGSLTITFPASTGMIANQVIIVYVVDSGTAPSDILFGAAGSGVTYQSYTWGLAASDLTAVSAAETKTRANACGTPQTNGVILYQFWWDGANLNLTNCGGRPSRATIPVALGGTNSSVGSLNNALQITNDAVTGTTADKLVSLTTANPAAAIITPAGSMSGIMGICDSALGTCGTSGTATVINYGDHNCVFDASGATAGHYVGPSTITAGACADVGAMSAGGLLIIGRVYGNCAASADCKINFLSTTDILNNGGVSSAVTFNTLPNAVSGGTSVNHLAQITSNAMVTIGTTATAGVQGICTANCGTGAPNPTIAVTGATSCAVAATATPGDYAVADASNAGDCADGGATFPVGGNEVVGTFLSTASAGKAIVMLWGPDVANSSGGGGGGVNAAFIGQPAVYSSPNAINGVPGVFHIRTTGTDQIFNLLTTPGRCLSPGAAPNIPVPCDIIVDPGVVDTETGPTLLGYTVQSPGIPPHQTLTIDNAKVIFDESKSVAGVTQPWPQDDGLVLGSYSTLRCIGHGNQNAVITDANNSALNSIVTTIGGIVLNKWQANTQMNRGDFVYDSAGTSLSTWRVLSCAGSGATYCKTNGSNPFTTASPAIYSTQVDGNVTWQVLRSGHRYDNLNLSASYVDINGCYVVGNQGAQVNNALRVSGVSGAFGYVQNVAAMGIGTGLGSLDATGGDAVLVDTGQNSGFCTANGVPLACCTGAAAGTCQSGATGAGNVSFYNLEPGPNGGAVSTTTGYIMRITGVGNPSAIQNVSVYDGQMGDIGSTNVSNDLVAMLSIENIRNVTFNDFYFENSPPSGDYAPPDVVRINAATNVLMLNDAIAGSSGNGGPPASTNSLHIVNSSANGIYYRGSIGKGGTSCTGCTAVNAIKNDIDSYTLLGNVSIGQPATYNYSTATSDYGEINDREITFLMGLQLNKMTAPTAPGASTCVFYAIANGGGGCDIDAKCGTSATATTIATNVGSGC